MTLHDRVRAIVAALPPGSALTVPVDELRRWLDTDGEPVPDEGATSVTVVDTQPWRVLLWVCDPEVRMSRDELLEATGRPRSWVYRATAAKATDRIPHRKIDGELVFVAGEVRHWLRQREEIVVAGPLGRADLGMVGGGR